MCIHSFTKFMLWHGPDPSFMDIWSKWRLNYDYANFAKSYIFHSACHLYYHFSRFDPKADKTTDDDGAGPISNLVYKHNLKAG